ncbi:hypothetical protein AQUCO_01200274v1 [Aquilegia coerulea]|uniref:F-box domain-containing protein n=1 Tax=Aquilegia coerulea TaxID=218851 RepID=A0A2G5E579_AQUCA|nr:hypothetical protein AQUCO_01200274v1 [Aquilegia coerulea]
MTIDMSISKLKELEGMEVNESFISGDFTLKRISQCCPNFQKLKVYNSLAKNTALLIATLLPKLKTLDLSSTRVHREDLLDILKGCVELENLDVSGCGTIWEQDELLTVYCKRLKEFKWDELNDSCSDCEEEYMNEYGGEDPDMDNYEYRWPCKHDGFHNYIEGTLDLPSLNSNELPPGSNQDWDDPSFDHVTAYGDYDYDDCDGNPYECDCDCGYGHGSNTTRVINNYDYSML